MTWSSFLTESLIVWIFLLFSPNFSPKDLEGFKADIAFIYTTLACSLAISTNLNFDLNFVTRNFIGSCVIRCALLVSRKDDCLERELRKSFWIKKLINKISLHLSNWFWEIFSKSNRKLFSCVCIAWYKLSRGWENSRRVCITVSNSPNPSRVYIRLCKHGKRFLLLKINRLLRGNCSRNTRVVDVSENNRESVAKECVFWYKRKGKGEGRIMGFSKLILQLVPRMQHHSYCQTQAVNFVHIY